MEASTRRKFVRGSTKASAIWVYHASMSIDVRFPNVVSLDMEPTYVGSDRLRKIATRTTRMNHHKGAALKNRKW